jgi:DNA excision repair protein ERCC-2
MGFSGMSRSTEEIVAHRKVQKSRKGEYAREVHVSYQVEQDNFVLEVSGRIDGVYTDKENRAKQMLRG